MFEFALPDLGEGVAEGEILEWHVDVGDAVEEDDILLEVETDKAAVEVPSPVDGTVAERHGEAGDVVETGAVIVTIDTDGEAEETESGEVEDEDAAVESAPAEDDEGESVPAAEDADVAAESTGNGQRVFAPPSVRRLARELGVAIESVSGSGPSGRVTEEDVRAAEGSDADTAAGEETDDESAATSGQTAQVKSAVRRVGDSDSADDTTATAETADDDPAVRSAVRSTASAADRERTLATPATRRLARELGVDVDAVPTDLERDGEPFVDESAVRSFAEREEATASDAETEGVEPTATETTATESTATEPKAPETTTDAGSETGEGASVEATTDRDVSVARTEPYRGIRRRIGERMAQSRREVPHPTHHDRGEQGELVAARDRLKPLAEDRGVNLTYTPFILKCVGAALQDHPVLNTRIDVEAEEIHYLDSYNVGVATDTERGLLVPVVRDVDDRGIMELAEATNDVVARARDGSIGPDEMQGGTFTVTNVGAIGGEYADPVINVPQTAVLAVGSLRERPVALNGEVEAKPTLPLSLAIDHRVIDGADAARFTNTLKTYLADPTRLLLE